LPAQSSAASGQYAAAVQIAPVPAGRLGARQPRFLKCGHRAVRKTAAPGLPRPRMHPGSPSPSSLALSVRLPLQARTGAVRSSTVASRTHGQAEPSDAAARITANLRLIRTNRLFRQDRIKRIPAKRLFYDPVLERVEADHGEPSARPQYIRKYTQRFGQNFQLMIHGNPQRLEGAGGRIDPQSGGAGNTGADELCHLGRRTQRADSPHLDDLPRNPPTVALLSELVYQVGDLPLRQPRKQLPGGFAVLGVEPQIQFAFRL